MYEHAINGVDRRQNRRNEKKIRKNLSILCCNKLLNKEEKEVEGLANMAKWSGCRLQPINRDFSIR